MTDNNSAPELRPCPFCGGDDIGRTDGPPEDDWVANICRDCHTRGPHNYSDAHAAAAWNRRAPADLCAAERDALARELAEVKAERDALAENRDKLTHAYREGAVAGHEKALATARSQIVAAQEDMRERAAQACADYPRVAPDSTEWPHYDDQIEHSQACIRALPLTDAAAAGAEMEAEIARLREALEEIASYDDGPMAGVAYTAKIALATDQKGGE